MTARVFIVQRPAKYDPIRKGWVNKFDLSSAEEFGRMVELLRPGNIHPELMGDAINVMRRKMADYAEEDYILAAGDPVAIAAAAVVAADLVDVVQILTFDRHTRRYQPRTIDMRTVTES